MKFSTQFINDNFDKLYELDKEQFPYDDYDAALEEEFGIVYSSDDDAEHFYYYYNDNEYQFVDEIVDDCFEVKEFIFNKIVETNKNIQAMMEELTKEYHQNKTKMLIDVIESMDEEHGTSLIEFDITSDDEDDYYCPNDYIINDADNDYCPILIDYIKEQFMNCCYWDLAIYKSAIEKYSKGLQQWINNELGIDEIYFQYKTVSNAETGEVLYVANLEDQLPAFDFPTKVNTETIFVGQMYYIVDVPEYGDVNFAKLVDAQCFVNQYFNDFGVKIKEIQSVKNGQVLTITDATLLDVAINKGQKFFDAISG